MKLLDLQIQTSSLPLQSEVSRSRGLLGPAPFEAQTHLFLLSSRSSAATLPLISLRTVCWETGIILPWRLPQLPPVHTCMFSARFEENQRTPKQVLCIILARTGSWYPPKFPWRGPNRPV